MNRQYSKTTVVSIARSRYLVSVFCETPNGFIVKTTGFDKTETSKRNPSKIAATVL